MDNGIHIINPFGRTGNHIITLAHGIYICRKFRTKWIKLDKEFIKTGIGGGGNIWIDSENIKSYTTATLPFKESELNDKLKPLTAYMVFHLSQFLGDNGGKLDINYYKELYECIYPIISNNISQLDDPYIFKNNNKNIIGTHLKKIGEVYNSNDELDEKILYTHIKFTDNLIQNLNHKYNVIPIFFYVKMMQLFDFNVLTVLTDNINSKYIIELKKEIQKIGKKILCVHSTLFHDFNIIMNAKYLLIDLSTFTWTAHLLSSKKQIVFIWEQFFSRFLAKYKHYVDISLFNINDVRKKYNLFKIDGFVDCGDWDAGSENINSCLNDDGCWNGDIQWLDSTRITDIIKEHNDNVLTIDSGEQISVMSSTDGVKKSIRKNDKSDKSDKSNRIALIGPGIMSIPPKGWGAVEILIWEYYQELVKLGWHVDIINTPNRNEIIEKVNTGNYGFIHLHYDQFYDILDKFNEGNKGTTVIAFTTHYPYIQKKEKHQQDGYSNIYKFMIKQNGYWNIIINDKDKKCMISDGASKKWFHQIKNGASSSKIKCQSKIPKKMEDRTICLGWITERKRQNYVMELIVKDMDIHIDFAGRKSDEKFDYKNKHYLGEWTKEEVYNKLTHYPNMLLLSGGEADPLVIKEGLMAGCGVVITESSAAHLDKSKPWITIIPTEKENDEKYIASAIIDNRNLCVKNQSKWRKEIRAYAEDYFSNSTIVKNYSNWVRLLIKKKPRILLVGTGISEIPAKGWGAVEGIVWEYYEQLRNLGFDVKIINHHSSDQLGNIKNMINDINKEIDKNASEQTIIHIFYDDRIDLIPFIKCAVNTRIFYTSHWAYLPQIKSIKQFPDREKFSYSNTYINGIFKKAVTNHHKVEYLLISDEIGKMYNDFGVPSDKIHVINNGANSDKFTCKSVDEMKFKDRAICLGKIDQRKRQSQLQLIDCLWFAGNIASEESVKFPDSANNRYLGEWSREQVYTQLTDYSTVVLLSDGEADPLTVKEAFMAGCGVVVSEYASANLDRSKPWITVVPNKIIDGSSLSKENLEFVENAIQNNIRKSINFRDEIRRYGEQEFDWSKIIYDKYLNLVFKN